MAWSSDPVVGSGAAPFELLDDGFAPDPCEVLVIGCGNILRGDDAVGPVLIRHLFERGVPAGCRIVDGGTAGMDVAFGMRGAERVVLIDASSTGAAPGTIYRVPGSELATLPPIDGLHTHNFRWDHALSFASWLLGPQVPTDITVFLIEADTYEPGAPLTPAVEAAMEQVIALIQRDHYPAIDTATATDTATGTGTDPAAEPKPEPLTVEITNAGDLHLPAAVAEKHFPGEALVARVVDDTVLELIPLISVGHGGLLLKRRNLAGDRSALISQVFDFRPAAGTFTAVWDEASGLLRVALAPAGTAPCDAGTPAGDAPAATAASPAVASLPVPAQELR